MPTVEQKSNAKILEQYQLNVENLQPYLDAAEECVIDLLQRLASCGDKKC